MKTLKLSAILCALAVMTLAGGCDSSGGAAAQKIIRVTGLSQYSGMYAGSALGSANSGDLVAMSDLIRIPSSGTVDQPLFDYDDGSEWTGSGKFVVVLLIYTSNTSNGQLYWSGGYDSYVTITNTVTTLPFSRYTYLSVNNFRLLEKASRLW